MPTEKHANTAKIANFTVPGVARQPADKLIALLETRLASLIDLQLTLKHIHWNVVGPNFIAVHEMLDPQVDAVREMTDDIAERIATLGGVPRGTATAVVGASERDEYPLGRASVSEHLGALDHVYSTTNAGMRKTMHALADLDPVSEDMLIGQLAQLEQFQWFVRAHLESAEGQLPTTETSSEREAAAAAKRA
jgi:starvation-inducible DNA-binding protein